MAFRKSLATKLLVTLVSIITLVLGVLILGVNRQVSRVAEEQATQLATQIAEQAAVTISSQFDEAMIPARTSMLQNADCFEVESPLRRSRSSVSSSSVRRWCCGRR